MATFHARQTFGATGYHQIHTLENIKRFINTGIQYSVLTSQGFKHITSLEPKGDERAYKLIVSLQGNRHEVITVASQTFWDFNQAKLVPLLELNENSAVLFNTSTDMRCNGVNIKYQATEIVDIKPVVASIDVFEMQLAIQNPKVYIDNLECGL